MRKLFNEEQENFIFDNYEKFSYKELSKMMCVSVDQIRSWINGHIKNKKDRRSDYSVEEENFIRKHFNDMTYGEISKLLNRSECAVKAKAERMGLVKERIFNKRYFKEIDDPEKAYWLGFLYADGYVIKNIKNRNYEVSMQLNIKDRYILEKLNNIIGGCHKIKDTVCDEREICGRTSYNIEESILRIYSKDMVLDLEKHGVVQNKTNSIIFPRVENYFWDFLRGFLDGDGCIYVSKKNKCVISFTNSNHKFLEYLRDTIDDKLSICGHIYTEKDKKHSLRFLRKEDVLLLLENIYYEDCLCLKRKLDKYKSFLAFSSRNGKVINRANSVNANHFMYADTELTSVM